MEFIERPFLNDYCENCINHYLLDGDESRCRKIKIGQSDVRQCAGMKKKELADLALRLFGNIDQAEQFNVNELFYHCDNKFLLEIIKDLAETVKENVAERGKRFSTRSENVCVDDEELEEIFALVKKALKGGAE